MSKYYDSDAATAGEKAAWQAANIARNMNSNKLLTYSTKLMKATNETFKQLMARGQARQMAMLDAMKNGADITPQLMKEYEAKFQAQIIDADGNIVDASDLITSASGTVLSKKLLASSGYNINEDGEIVDANGNKLSENDISSIAAKQSITGKKTTASGIYQVVVGGSKDGISTTSNVTIPQERTSETTTYVGGQSD